MAPVAGAVGATGAAGATEGAPFTTVATMPRLAAGAGSALALSGARAASDTLISRVLHATAVNENPIANMAAPSALTATQRVFSEPVMVNNLRRLERR